MHYFEDGNLQLLSSKPMDHPIIVRFLDEADLLKHLVDIIEKEETALHTNLHEMYSSMNDETFRSMRRTMPITRTKMEWNINAVRMIKQTRK